MSNYRPNFHVTPESGWMNDIQRPLYINGVHHLFYLYNKDFSWGGNGTEWAHAESTDLKHWKRRPVAIPKYTDASADPWTGSAVVDENNTAGFGKGAIIALVTMPKPGYQCTHLWYSTDEGNHFEHYNADPSSETPQPVMKNPTGSADFRDPKVIWHENTQSWIMLLAEGIKIGFYKSKNLKDWEYLSGFVRTDIGVVECPDLFQINLDENPNEKKWVLIIGANGFNYGLTTGTCYFVGDFDGVDFKAETDIQWLEKGADSYAGATWDAPYTNGNYRYYMSWMNNWAYALELPWETYNGNASIVRELRLKTTNGAPRLVQQPIWNLSNDFAEVLTLNNFKLTRDETIKQTDLKSYTVELVVRLDGNTKGKFGIALRDGVNHTDLSYDATINEFVFNRQQSGVMIDTPEFYNPQRVTISPKNDLVKFNIVVDNSTIELFINDGEEVLSNMIFPEENSTGFRIWTDEQILIENLSIKKTTEIFIN
ncbi:glycoside hydrolase family 32 protein [Bacillus subtilis]|uniref:glycoside hydrolase family 32 protein n=1 Tax=Bacillus subtilis TaxID=1423 RepID=UPI0025C904ED|nr:glycoside hydrolase family 32 protein [Bacillus subtilis]GLI90531.1 levanbiose-producing levanase [Bacillus subtilis]